MKISLECQYSTRRYAAELGYRVPEAEEGEVWRVFDEQPPAERLRMIERFDRTTLGGYGVREEALCYLP